MRLVAALSRRIQSLLVRAQLAAEQERRRAAARNAAIDILHARAAETSADFIEANMDGAMLFPERMSGPAFWNYVLGAIPPGGLLIEAGVWTGGTINRIADWLIEQQDPRLVHGFDSFEGLQEDWSGSGMPKGSFDLGGRLPPVRPNVRLIKGWVQDTLGPFLATVPGEPLALLHIDTDTYPPARFILDAIAPRLVPGSVIVFDQLIGYPNWQAHEARALREALPRDAYRFIAFTGRQAALRITRALD